MSDKKAIKLSRDDFENGLEIEKELAELRARLNAVTNAYQVYVAILRNRYNAPDGVYELRDWAVGFEPLIEVEND